MYDAGESVLNRKFNARFNATAADYNIQNIKVYMYECRKGALQFDHQQEYRRWGAVVVYG